jgi:hypothetical protein
LARRIDAKRKWRARRNEAGSGGEIAGAGASIFGEKKSVAPLPPNESGLNPYISNRDAKRRPKGDFAVNLRVIRVLQ